MDVSVLIGTYNRAPLLERTLAALGAQEYPASLRWEIVVVDNNSQDGTARCVDAFAARSPVPVRRVHETRQGVSHARNRGIEEARGHILAFTDDDVLPASDWVAGVPAAIDRWAADGVGGRILPLWETPPPAWLAQNRRLLDHLALMDFAGSGLLALPLPAGPQVWGANMAFRRDLFDRVGTFDPCRGMRGRKLYRGEDTDLVNRALAAGLRIAYDPRLTVSHRIGADRMRRAYFCKLSFDRGECDVQFGPAARGRTLGGAPRWMYRAVVTDLGRWLTAELLGRPDALTRRLDWFDLAGQLSGYRKLRGGAPLR